MTFESFREYCLTKPGTTEDYPFDGTSAWIKVAGKLFALANVSEMKIGKEEIPPFHFMNLKCDPERAIELREEHEAIQPGWHMSKKHWNSVYLKQGLRDSFIKGLIDHSYDIVVAGLPKKLEKNYKITKMNKSETLFMNLVNMHSTADPDVHLGKMMSAPGLKYKDKVFAFYTKENAMGFRLGKKFSPNNAGLNKYRPLSPFKKKPPLKGWYIVDKEESNTWEYLTELSLTFTKTLK